MRASSRATACCSWTPYDVEQGIRNAITVGLEMRARGERLAGIRIDSGDLAWLAKMARRMPDEAGF